MDVSLDSGIFRQLVLAQVAAPVWRGVVWLYRTGARGGRVFSRLTIHHPVRNCLGRSLPGAACARQREIGVEPFSGPIEGVTACRGID